MHGPCLPRGAGPAQRDLEVGLARDLRHERAYICAQLDAGAGHRAIDGLERRYKVLRAPVLVIAECGIRDLQITDDRDRRRP